MDVLVRTIIVMIPVAILFGGCGYALFLLFEYINKVRRG